VTTRNEKWETVHCNLCGSEGREKCCTYGAVTIVRCKHCGLIYRNPRYSNEANREFYGHRYYEEYRGIEERIFNARLPFFDRTLKDLRRMVRSPGRLLDVGCGYGHFLNMARSDGWQVSGTELAASARDYAREQFGIEVADGDALEGGRFQDGSFDVVTLWNVLDHLLDPVKTLGHIGRVLKPGGTLAIRVPNADFHLFVHRMFSLGMFTRKGNSFRDPTMIAYYGFSGATIRKVLRKAGFDEVEVRNSGLTFGDPYQSCVGDYTGMGDIMKGIYLFIARLIFFVTFERLTVGPSLLVYATRTPEAQGKTPKPGAAQCPGPGHGERGNGTMRNRPKKLLRFVLDMKYERYHVRSILANPAIWQFFKRIIAGKFYSVLVDKYLRVKEGDDILDIGCGIGDILEHLPQVRYTGFDSDRRYIEMAAKRYGDRARFHCLTIGETVITVDPSYDLVMATGVLHHLTWMTGMELFRPFCRRVA